MFSDPHTVISQLRIAPGSAVADLGAGIGAYSVLLSKVVGPEGKIYACDVQKDLLVRLDNELKEKGITNVQTVLSNIEAPQGTRLREASVDWVILANTLFQSEDRPGLATEIARILKPSGAVALIEWSESFGNIGPHEKDVVTKVEAEKLFRDAGLLITPQLVDAGSHHYGAVFKKIV